MSEAWNIWTVFPDKSHSRQREGFHPSKRRDVILKPNKNVTVRTPSVGFDLYTAVPNKRQRWAFFFNTAALSLHKAN